MFTVFKILPLHSGNIIYFDNNVLICFIRRADKNKTGRIDRNGFTWAVKEVGLVLTKHDLDKLFRYLDKNYENAIDYKAYLDLLRVPLTPRRREAVARAFHAVDLGHNGSVPLVLLAERYNPTASAKVK